MTKEEMDFEFTETNLDLLHPEVYARISKEAVGFLFDAKGVAPINANSKPDDSYDEGEIQFIFSENGTKLDEILVFPVYDDGEGGYMNGANFILAPDEFWQYEKDVLEELKKAKENK